MNITHDDWRDGVGYDLSALAEIDESERDRVVQLLARRLESTPDWREVEALGCLDTPQSRAALRAAAQHGKLETRMRAAKQLLAMGEPADLNGVIIEALRKTNLSNGLSQAIDMAEMNPSPEIQETLLDLSLHGDEDQRVQCAALALYLGGQADEAFDWNHRPFLLQFGEDDRDIRLQAYEELCRRLGVPSRA